MPKVSIDKTMDDIVSIQNQISGLTMLLNQKKQVMAKYFKATGKRSVENENCFVFISERTNIEYDMHALMQALPKELLKYFVETERTIVDYKGLSTFLKDHGISPKELKPYIHVKRSVNQAKLNSLYEHGKLDIKQLAGCYAAEVKRSIVLRMRNVEQEIPIKKEK
nr:MAG TPA: TBP-associated factor [Caudoviricetes sp.]